MTIKTDSFGIAHEVTIDELGTARNSDGFCIECLYIYCECM